MPDPKLQTAMEEIRAVLKRHDIGAVVVLSSPTHMEFLREYSPSWSCISFEATDDGLVLRVKALRKDFNSAEEHQKKMRDTIGLVFGFADALKNESEQLDGVQKMIARAMPVEYMTKLEERTQTKRCAVCGTPAEVSAEKCGVCGSNEFDKPR